VLFLGVVVIITNVVNKMVMKMQFSSAPHFFSFFPGYFMVQFINWVTCKLIKFIKSTSMQKHLAYMNSHSQLVSGMVNYIDKGSVKVKLTINYIIKSISQLVNVVGSNVKYPNPW